MWTCTGTVYLSVQQAEYRAKYFPLISPFNGLSEQ